MSSYLISIFLKCQIGLVLNWFKNNGLGLLFKTKLWHSQCFLSLVAMDGKDGNGLKLEKVGPTFSSFDATYLNQKYQKT